MADVAVEQPTSALPTTRKAVVADAIPDIDSLEGVGADEDDEYSQLKRYQRHLEYVLLVVITVSMGGATDVTAQVPEFTRGIYQG